MNKTWENFIKQSLYLENELKIKQSHGEEISITEQNWLKSCRELINEFGR